MFKNKIIASLGILAFSLTSFNITSAYEPGYEKELENKVNNIIEKYENIQLLQRNSEKIDYKGIINFNNLKGIENHIFNDKDKRIIEEYLILKNREPINPKNSLNGDDLIMGISSRNNKNYNLRNSSNYNRKSAVNYALRWTETGKELRNKNYNYYEGLNDCTNFVSQVIHNGGLPFINNGFWPSWRYTNNRFYNSNKPSHTWGGAHNLYEHFQNHSNHSGYYSRFKVAHSLKEMENGDIIHIDFEGDNKIDHTVVITDIGFGDGNTKITYHTPDTKNITINNFINRAKNAGYNNPKFYLWKITY